MDRTEAYVTDLVRMIAAEFRGFSITEIGSKKYLAKVTAIEKSVVALARLHPRWSENRKTIRSVAVVRHTDEEGEDPMFFYYEYLFTSWRHMRASHPTADSLNRGIPQFITALGALCRETSTPLML